jgi:hypothetical protein
MSADVQASGRSFVLTITDTTTGKSFTISISAKRAQRSSAEWIVEAPSSGGGILPLANYGTMSLTNNTATDATHTGNISNSSWQYDAITMASGGTTKATVSSLSSGDIFTDTFKHQ